MYPIQAIINMCKNHMCKNQNDNMIQANVKGRKLKYHKCISRMFLKYLLSADAKRSMLERVEDIYSGTAFISEDGFLAQFNTLSLF